MERQREKEKRKSSQPAVAGSCHSDAPFSAAMIRLHRHTSVSPSLSCTHSHDSLFKKHTFPSLTRTPSQTWPRSRVRTCVFKVSMATVSRVIYYSTWSLSGWYTRLLATITPWPPVISSLCSAHTPSSSLVIMNMIYSCLLSSRCSSYSTVCDRFSTSVITLLRGNLCGAQSKANSSE